MTDGGELYPYQQHGVDALTGILTRSPAKAAYLADAPGLGKSAQAVRLALSLGLTRVLVVCPASVRLNWARELDRWSDGALRAQVLRSGKDAPAADVLVASYSLVVRQPTLDALLATAPFDLLVLDEAHTTKSPSSQAARVCLVSLWAHARFRLGLSGTPVPNGRAAEAFTVFCRMAPDLFGDWTAFKQRYCVEAPNPNDPRPGAVWYPRSRNLDELGRLARERFLVRRTRAVIADQLPPMTREVFYLDVPELEDVDAARAADAELAPLFDPALVERIVARVRGGGDADPLPRESDAVPTARRKLAALKAGPAVGYVRELVESGVPRVVVFVHHVAAFHAVLEGLLNADGVEQVWSLSGSMPADDRQAAVDAFQALKGTPTTAVFVASLLAASTGLTLTAADTVVFVEWDWVPSTNTQAEARVARLTQASAACRAVYLVAPDTLDEAVLGAVMAKQRDIKEVLPDVPAGAVREK